MNDATLFRKAIDAGYHYRVVYGHFPERIGVHPLCLDEIPPLIAFPDLSTESLCYTVDASLSGCKPMPVHRSRVEPITGPEIELYEVYVPVVGGVISGKHIAIMAEHKQHSSI